MIRYEPHSAFTYVHMHTQCTIVSTYVAVLFQHRQDLQKAHLAEDDLPLPFHAEWLHVVEQKHGCKLRVRLEVHLGAPGLLSQTHNPKVVTDGKDPSTGV